MIEQNFDNEMNEFQTLRKEAKQLGGTKHLSMEKRRRYHTLWYQLTGLLLTKEAEELADLTIKLEQGEGFSEKELQRENWLFFRRCGLSPKEADDYLELQSKILQELTPEEYQRFQELKFRLKGCTEKEAKGLASKEGLRWKIINLEKKANRFGGESKLSLEEQMRLWELRYLMEDFCDSETAQKLASLRVKIGGREEVTKLPEEEQRLIETYGHWFWQEKI